MSKRRKWRLAGDALKNLTNSNEAPHRLTPEEYDWTEILRDRFYEIANRGLHGKDQTDE